MDPGSKESVLNHDDSDNDQYQNNLVSTQSIRSRLRSRSISKHEQ